MTSLTRSSEVKAILAMAGTSILWADQSTIWALRHRTTEPDPRRTIERSCRPSSLVISLTATRSAMALLGATARSKWWTRPTNVAGHGTRSCPSEFPKSVMLVDCFPDLVYLDYKLISNQPPAQSTQSNTGVADATCRYCSALESCSQ